MNAEDALLAIQDLLDGTVWTPETTEEIARILVKAGYRIRDRHEKEIEECE